jgi:hypothetical protein
LHRVGELKVEHGPPIYQQCNLNSIA